MQKPAKSSTEADCRQVLEETLSHALNYLSGLKQTSVSATADLTDLRNRLFKPLNLEDSKEK